MSKGSGRILSLFSILLVSGALAAVPQTAPSGTGQLVGFVFGSDGTTPVSGAVVTVRNVTTGSSFESAPSDTEGVFRMTGLERGIYALGVASETGRFNAPEPVGIAPEETTKVTVALIPYDPDIAAAAQQVTQDQKDKGEAYIGRVIRYLPETKQIEVLIERGLLQVGDRIRVKTDNRDDGTDFQQDAKVLEMNGASLKRLLIGQTGLVLAANSALPGDSVYIICKRGIPPIFLLPLGIAATGIIIPKGGEEEASPFKVRK